VTVAAPATLSEVAGELQRDSGAQLLAGGTDFMVEVNFAHRRPTSVIALRGVSALHRWHAEEDNSAVVLGAGVTYREVLDGPLAALMPALAEASRTVGSPQIRNAGTIGGNLGTCSPAGDALPVLSALDAQVELLSADGFRRLSVHDFMVGVKRTALGPGEFVSAVEVPRLRGWQGYAKVGVRNAMVISTASVCLATDLDGRTVRVAMGAVGPTILRARAAEEWVRDSLDWRSDGIAAVSPALAAEFGRRVAAEAKPIDDHRSTAAYRRHAVEVLARRLLVRACQA
jgi:CO/xanthine dehydrogenase FAD-binding subunit